MRRSAIALVALLLVAFVTSAHAQSDELRVIRDQVLKLQEALKTALDRIAELEAKCATAPATTTPAQPPTAKWYDKLSWNGYFQARYEAREDAGDDFSIRRLYLHLMGNWSPKAQSIITLSRIPLSTDPVVELEAAQVSYRFCDDWSFTFGQVYNNFGWDTWESSAKRLPFERWATGEGVAARPDRAGIKGIYFAGPADRGMYITRHATKPSEPTVLLGLVNGNFRAADNNNNKTVSVDARWKQDWGQFGASWLSGDYTMGSSTNARKALDLYVHTDPTPWGFQAEYLQGELFGADIEGWYGQVAYNCSGGAGTPYVRYEQYDPDEDASGNTYVSLRLGYAYQVDKNNEVTLEWQDADQGDLDYGQLGFQWQLAW